MRKKKTEEIQEVNSFIDQQYEEKKILQVLQFGKITMETKIKHLRSERKEKKWTKVNYVWSVQTM